MQYYTLPAPPDLAAYVRYFWVLEGSASYIHRSMADGCAEMLFHYRGQFDNLYTDGQRAPSWLSGLQGPSRQYSRYEYLQSFESLGSLGGVGGFGIFGVYLYPFALPALFGISASALSGQSPDLESLCGSAGKNIEEQIMLAPDHLGRRQLLADFFRICLRRQQPSALQRISPAIRHLIAAGGHLRIDALAAQHYYSLRQFERHFQEMAGFSPKLYARILRFQAAIAHYGDPQLSLSSLAQECGYYDQSHFNSDFREFSGYTPGQYFRGAAEGTAWREAV